ncbi:nucleotidyltransferase family protein [Sneathiella aquimaris]|uniref:nucleotidyltransferase family protein n=1 Tax=Sneathiella aquimaris TaxID=2599305 RepID=UPI00146E34C1|nr:nucleotidyltransferase family protein [Sneathiella aquimaris]
MTHAETLRTLIQTDPLCMTVLKNARQLTLLDWAIGAGFIRNRVWDHLYHKDPCLPDDIDFLYFDASDVSPAADKTIEKKALTQAPDFPWSVKNQARMHLKNKDAPYRNTADAIAHWLETPTAIAVRLEADDRLTIMAPFGLEDLFSGTVRPTPSGQKKMDQYSARLKGKNWQARWPDLTIIKAA